jgi:hypothetical protein
MTLWLIEGLPGTGKTTMAEQLCILARKSGLSAAWYLEESIDHPVHGRKLKEGRKNGDIFVKSCLEAWRAFADNSTKTPDIQILEGSAFQSTVRFMMGGGHFLKTGKGRQSTGGTVNLCLCCQVLSTAFWYRLA